MRDFVAHCLRALWDDSALESARRSAGREPVDWAAFRRVAGEEKVAPLLYPILREWQVVPAAAKGALEEAYYRQAAHASLLLHELEGILSRLAGEGVPVLLLKGAALQDTAYAEAGPRPMDDLDLLVPRDRVGAAAAGLRALGYSALTAEPWPGFTWRYGYARQYGRRSGSGFPLFVGLHIGLYDVPFYERIPLGDWFRRASAVPGTPTGALIPATADHLVYLCGHLALQHGHEPALLRLLDLALLIRWAGPSLDWEQVVDRAADWRLVIPVQQTLARLEEVWPGTVPTAAGAGVSRLTAGRAERRVFDRVSSRHRPAVTAVLLALATMPGLGRRVRFLLEAAIPSPAYMRWRYCPHHPGLWPLAYLQRAGMAARGLVRHRS